MAKATLFDARSLLDQANQEYQRIEEEFNNSNFISKLFKVIKLNKAYENAKQAEQFYNELKQKQGL